MKEGVNLCVGGTARGVSQCRGGSDTLVLQINSHGGRGDWVPVTLLKQHYNSTDDDGAPPVGVVLRRQFPA